MTQLKFQKKIQEIADKIAKKYQPEKNILFGSHTWFKKADEDLALVKMLLKGSVVSFAIICFQK